MERSQTQPTYHTNNTAINRLETYRPARWTRPPAGLPRPSVTRTRVDSSARVRPCPVVSVDSPTAARLLEVLLYGLLYPVEHHGGPLVQPGNGVVLGDRLREGVDVLLFQLG